MRIIFIKLTLVKKIIFRSSLSLLFASKAFAGLPITLDMSTYQGNGTPSSSDPGVDFTIVSNTTLGQVNAISNGMGMLLKYEVAGGALNITRQSGGDLYFETVGDVSSFEFEIFYDETIERRWTSRVTGFTAYQFTGATSGTGSWTYYDGDGNAPTISDGLTPPDTTINVADIYTNSPTDDIVAFNGEVVSPGVISTTDTTYSSEMTDQGYSMRFGVMPGREGELFGGQEFFVTANGSGTFEDSTDFRFTFDGQRSENPVTTPFSSTISVPEPSSVLLLFLGSGVALQARRRH